MSSVRLRQAPPFADLIGQRLALSRPVGRSDLRIAFTSFREIISVVGRTRVGVRIARSSDCGKTAALSKSSTLTKSVTCRAATSGIAPARREANHDGNRYMLLTGEDMRDLPRVPGGTQRCGVFLLPGQIKRDKGVWWMPWQQEAMKDAIPCDKLWGAGNRL